METEGVRRTIEQGICPRFSERKPEPHTEAWRKKDLEKRDFGQEFSNTDADVGVRIQE